MSNVGKLSDPWLVAAWPGMGGVAISAGYYLMAKLGMHLLVEFPASEYFDLERIEVRDGMILNKRLPRSRLFLWKDPREQHDLIVFIGEAQPPIRGGAFCRKIINQAKELGVQRVFTFAAMATEMRPKHESRVFSAAIDRATQARFDQLGLTPMANGAISGLNGVLLGMAANTGLPGGCLLGEIPQIFSQIPFPKASLAVLRKFSSMSGIDLDFTELQNHAETVERTLEIFLARMEDSIAVPPPDIELDPESSPIRQPVGAKDRQRIERLFQEARGDRTQAYQLKQELDRQGLFDEFEDRFLDLFKEP